jgi:hypothetical protein
VCATLLATWTNTNTAITTTAEFKQVGTAGVSMIELSSDTGDCLHRDDATGTAAALDNGHAGQQLWGLACSSSAPEYCTVGEDR